MLDTPKDLLYANYEMVQQTTEDIIKKANIYFRIRSEVDEAYLFGSLVSGRMSRLSDIDVAVIVAHEKIQPQKFPYGYKAKILADLMGLFKTNAVDLVLLNEASCLLRHRAIFRGKLVFSRDDAKRIAFQVRTLDDYNDLKKLTPIRH